MNWYNYVGSDPINFTDPTGLCSVTQFAHFTHFVNPDGTLELKSFDGFSYVPDGCSFADIGLGSPSTNGLLEMAFANAAEEKRDACDVPPGGPGKAELDANIAEAARIGRTFPISKGPNGLYVSSRWFAGQVSTGGPWDYKNLENFPEGQNFGNFNYGATAAAIGYSWGQAKSAANLYSIYDNRTLESQIPIIAQGFIYTQKRCNLNE